MQCWKVLNEWCALKVLMFLVNSELTTYPLATNERVHKPTHCFVAPEVKDSACSMASASSDTTATSIWIFDDYLFYEQITIDSSEKNLTFWWKLCPPGLEKKSQPNQHQHTELKIPISQSEWWSHEIVNCKCKTMSQKLQNSTTQVQLTTFCSVYLFLRKMFPKKKQTDVESRLHCRRSAALDQGRKAIVHQIRWWFAAGRACAFKKAGGNYRLAHLKTKENKKEMEEMNMI